MKRRMIWTGIGFVLTAVIVFFLAGDPLSVRIFSSVIWGILAAIVVGVFYKSSK